MSTPVARALAEENSQLLCYLGSQFGANPDGLSTGASPAILQETPTSSNVSVAPTSKRKRTDTDSNHPGQRAERVKLDQGQPAPLPSAITLRPIHPSTNTEAVIKHSPGCTSPLTEPDMARAWQDNVPKHVSSNSQDRSDTLGIPDDTTVPSTSGTSQGAVNGSNVGTERFFCSEAHEA